MSLTLRDATGQVGVKVFHDDFIELLRHIDPNAATDPTTYAATGPNVAPANVRLTPLKVILKLEGSTDDKPKESNELIIKEVLPDPEAACYAGPRAIIETQSGRPPARVTG